MNNILFCPTGRSPLSYLRVPGGERTRHLPRHHHFYSAIPPGVTAGCLGITPIPGTSILFERCVIMEYLNAFLCGGILCIIGQLLIDKTPLTPAKILVSYVTAGVILSGLGLYQHLVDWGGAGRHSTPHGFGHLLAKGVKKAVAGGRISGRPHWRVHRRGGGITAAIFFGFASGPSL